jgi:hypothetical protein
LCKTYCKVEQNWSPATKGRKGILIETANFEGAFPSLQNERSLQVLPEISLKIEKNDKNRLSST